MQTKTALAVAGSVLAVPSTALAAADDNHPADPGAQRHKDARGYSRGTIHERNQRRRARRRPSTASAPLQAIAACESGGNPSTNTGNGFYGKYQFTQQTWASVAGTGNPAAASEAEQDRRAAMLYAREGASPWPVCGL